jgi:hypothetical protein
LGTDQLDGEEVKHALDKLRLPHSLIHPELSINKDLTFDEFKRSNSFPVLLRSYDINV